MFERVSETSFVRCVFRVADLVAFVVDDLNDPRRAVTRPVAPEDSSTVVGGQTDKVRAVVSVVPLLRHMFQFSDHATRFHPSSLLSL